MLLRAALLFLSLLHSVQSDDACKSAKTDILLVLGTANPVPISEVKSFASSILKALPQSQTRVGMMSYGTTYVTSENYVFEKCASSGCEEKLNEMQRFDSGRCTGHDINFVGIDYYKKTPSDNSTARIMVIVTNGEEDCQGIDSAKEASEAARDLGVVVYYVGVGKDKYSSGPALVDLKTFTANTARLQFIANDYSSLVSDVSSKLITAICGTLAYREKCKRECVAESDCKSLPGTNCNGGCCSPASDPVTKKAETTTPAAVVATTEKVYRQFECAKLYDHKNKKAATVFTPHSGNGRAEINFNVVKDYEYINDNADSAEVFNNCRVTFFEHPIGDIRVTNIKYFPNSEKGEYKFPPGAKVTAAACDCSDDRQDLGPPGPNSAPFSGNQCIQLVSFDGRTLYMEVDGSKKMKKNIPAAFEDNVKTVHIRGGCEVELLSDRVDDPDQHKRIAFYSTIAKNGKRKNRPFDWPFPKGDPKGLSGATCDCPGI